MLLGEPPAIQSGEKIDETVQGREGEVAQVAKPEMFLQIKEKIIEIIGWYGTAAIIGAYALNSFGIFSPNNIWYQLLNLTGALGIVIVSFPKKAYQPAVLNVIWIIIALVAIIRILFA